MKSIRTAMLVILLAALAATAASAAGKFDHIITAADVETATGLTGVRQVPREPLDKFRNGDLNFVRKDGQPILMIQFRPAFVFDAMKSDSGYFKAAVPGIGEEAFTSPAFAPQFSINFRKGGYVTVVTTNVDPKDKTRTILPMDRLSALAKLIASRM